MPENGENQSSWTCDDVGGAVPAYTLTRATIAKSIRVMNSAPSRNCWSRAESSIPRQQIHVITTIQPTPMNVTQNVVGLSLPNSWKV